MYSFFRLKPHARICLLGCAFQPKFCPTVHPGDVPDLPGYNVSLLRAALELMVEASAECTGRAFLYDLVDVAREWLSMSPCIDAWHNISCHDAGSCTADPALLAREVQAFADVNKVRLCGPARFSGNSSAYVPAR